MLLVENHRTSLAIRNSAYPMNFSDQAVILWFSFRKTDMALASSSLGKTLFGANSFPSGTPSIVTILLLLYLELPSELRNSKKRCL